MFALISLVVCLSGTPSVCQTVLPGYLHADTGQPPTFHECLGIGGQAIAVHWLRENPGYRLRRVQCSIGNDLRYLRERVADQPA
jgi:hypothetical protein